MRHTTHALLALSFALALTAPATRADEARTPDSWLDAVRARHLDLRAAGLNSLVAELSLTSHKVPGMGAEELTAKVIYRWKAPAEQRIDFEQTPKDWQKSISKVIDQWWRDLSGELLLDAMRGADERSLTRTQARIELRGAIKRLGPFRAQFARRARQLELLEFPRAGLKLVWRFEPVKAGKTKGPLRVSAREVWKQGKKTHTLRYVDHRPIGAHQLPTRVLVEGGDETLEFAVRYRTINGAAPRASKNQAAQTKKAFAEQLAQVEQRWPRSSEADKLTQLKILVGSQREEAARLIARLGLADRSAAVRKASAMALGQMKQRVATAALLAALERNTRAIEVYVACCWALGELGDPAAVRPLSKNWWQHNTAGEKGLEARIYAVGKIRSKESVDALVGLIWITEGKDLGRYKKVILAGLRQLTGQDFGEDRRGWRSWWKANRAQHVFK